MVGLSTLRRWFSTTPKTPPHASVFDSPNRDAFLDAVEAEFGIILQPRARRALANMDDLMAIVRDTAQTDTGTRPNPHAVWGTLTRLAETHR